MVFRGPAAAAAAGYHRRLRQVTVIAMCRTRQETTLSVCGIFRHAPPPASCTARSSCPAAAHSMMRASRLGTKPPASTLKARHNCSLRHLIPCRGLPPFVQLHLFIFVLLISAAVSVMLQPHAYAGQMDLLSMSSIAFLMFMSLYFVAYAKQPSCARPFIGPCASHDGDTGITTNIPQYMWYILVYTVPIYMVVYYHCSNMVVFLWSVPPAACARIRGARWICLMRVMLHKLDPLLTRGSGMCNHLFV